MAADDLNERLRRISQTYAQALEESLGERLVSVVLFGSVARAEANPFSDIDLLVVAGDLPRGRFARRKILEAADQVIEEELQDLRKQEVWADLSVIIQTPEEAGILRPLYLDFLEDAIILFERGGFFGGVLERLKRSMQRLGSRRLQLGKVRYWDLKPDLVPGEIFEL